MRKLLILFLVFTAAILIIFSIVAITHRSWIRTSLIPGYVRRFYASAVMQAYNDEFAAINDRLASYGFKFDKGILRCGDRENATFEGFSETVPCNDASGVTPFTVTPNFKAKWQQDSLQFERYLLSNGWLKGYFQKQSINGLFDVVGYDGSIAVNYGKWHGQLSCNLSIIYYPTAPYANQIGAYESCGRDVTFFGGSDG